MQEEQQENQLARAEQRRNMNDFNVIRMRLDTHELLDQIELFLRGSRYTLQQNEQGRYTSQEIKMGSPKANKLGIQSIMNWLTGTINPHVVQGNFPVDKHQYSPNYERYIEEFQLNIGKYLVLNCYEFGLEEEEIEGMIDFIMNVTIPFMSRLIGNKERASYTKTMETKEAVVHGGKALPTFAK